MLKKKSLFFKLCSPAPTFSRQRSLGANRNTVLHKLRDAYHLIAIKQPQTSAQTHMSRINTCSSMENWSLALVLTFVIIYV